MYKKIFLLLSIISLCVPDFVSALEITPIRQALSIKPGNQEVVRLKVTNDSNNQARFKPSIDSFSTSKKGAIQYGQNDVAENWVNYNLSPFVLSAGESKTLTYNLKIPDKIESKSHYLVLFVEKLGENGNVNISSRVGSLLFIHIAGTVRESLVLNDFSPDRKFYFNDDISFNLSLRNEGSIHLEPSGQVVLTNQFGESLGKQDIERQLVLPDNLYNKNIKFDNLSWKDVGKIEADFYLQYGRSGQPLSSKASFWYFPKKLLYLVGGFSVVVFIFYLKKRDKSDEKKI